MSEYFHDDGWQRGIHIGVVVPDADIGPEAEVQTLLGDRATVHASRVHFAAMRSGGRMVDVKLPHQPVGDFTDPPAIDDAVTLLAQSPLQGIGLAFTSSSYERGAVAEDAVVTRVEAVSEGIPVTTTCLSVVAALHRLGLSSIALLNPPWFDDALNESGVRYFADRGIRVGHRSAVELPSEQRAITPELLSRYVESVVTDEEAVFIAGNGQRAIGAIAHLEQRLSRPVLTANQALLWNVLRLADLTVEIIDYGHLFRTSAVDRSSIVSQDDVDHPTGNDDHLARIVAAQ